MQEIIHTENLAYLQSQPDNHFDFAVLDPPYGLGKITSIENLLTDWLSGGTGLDHQTNGFMNKDWDVLPAPVFWKELLRTVKPGGHIAVFAGSRTQDLMGLSLRLGGWDLRNTLAWIYATGFPKSLNVSKALDAKQGAKGEIIGYTTHAHGLSALNKKHGARPYVKGLPSQSNTPIAAPATELAKVYDGYGTDLKPAYEPIILARKPFNSTVAENVEKWGTGGLNLAACKVGDARYPGITRQRKGIYNDHKSGVVTDHEGRFPPNLLFSHSLWCVEGAECTLDCPVAALDRQSGVTVSPKGFSRRKASSNQAMENRNYARFLKNGHNDVGAASKFYPNFHFSEEDMFFIFRFIAKASPGERNKGLSDLPRIRKVYNGKNATSSPDMKGVEQKMTTDAQNIHPTVKPVAIMRWLCELLAPPTLNGVVPIGLDPFVGSGTTALAAYSLGLRFVGLEQDANYFEIAQKRLDAARLQLRLEDYLQQLDNAAGLAELG